MIDPMQALVKTSSLLVPLPTSTSTASPIPTVTPDVPLYEVVDHAGKTTLWIVFVIMLLSTITFIGMATRVTVQKRLFHIVTAFITLFATLSYFAMATGDGNSFTHIIVKEKHNHVPNTETEVFRQIFWARYVDWALTTPLLLLDLAFLAGLNGADILVSIVADIFMVLTGLFAAFGHGGGQKWGYYTMGCISYLLIVWIFAVGGRRTAKTKNASTAKFFAAIGGFTLVLWTLYPIVWGLGDGGRILSVDGEIIAYAVLDVLAKPVFGFWLLITHARSASASSVEGFWSNGLSDEGSLRLEDDEGT
ncbi:MAG: hypothetical protein M1818_008433 [Claussenomyces sp. TS43310]|nr:MAG: hypothetical protein M1818_008433 [Claussenomyces sp. TS43310]